MPAHGHKPKPHHSPPKTPGLDLILCGLTRIADELERTADAVEALVCAQSDDPAQAARLRELAAKLGGMARPNKPPPPTPSPQESPHGQV